MFCVCFACSTCTCAVPGNLDLHPAGRGVFRLFELYLPPSLWRRDVCSAGPSGHFGLVSHLNGFISRRDKSKSAVDLLTRWSALIAVIYLAEEEILQIVFNNFEIVLYLRGS